MQIQFLHNQAEAQNKFFINFDFSHSIFPSYVQCTIGVITSQVGSVCNKVTLPFVRFSLSYFANIKLYVRQFACQQSKSFFLLCLNQHLLLLSIQWRHAVEVCQKYFLLELSLMEKKNPQTSFRYDIGSCSIAELSIIRLSLKRCIDFHPAQELSISK
jgi:hypothetical protein